MSVCWVAVIVVAVVAGVVVVGEKEMDYTIVYIFGKIQSREELKNFVKKNNSQGFDYFCKM